MKEHKKLVNKNGVSLVVNGGNLEKSVCLYSREKPISAKSHVNSSAMTRLTFLSFELHKRYLYF